MISHYTIGKNYSHLVTLQKYFANAIVNVDVINCDYNTICGIDVSYRNCIAYCFAIVMDKDSLNVIESVKSSSSITAPYIPGLFFLREAPPILNTLRQLKNPFDLLFIDGHGQLHPRYCGLASFIGLIVDRPTIGVAKNLLCGKVLENNYIEYKGKILGYCIKKRKGKGVYISTGNKISLETSIKLVNDLTKHGEILPEPLRLADLYSKRYSRQ